MLWKNTGLLKYLLQKFRLHMLWAQPLYLPVKWQWSRTFLYFSASFSFLYEFLNLSPHIKQWVAVSKSFLSSSVISISFFSCIFSFISSLISLIFLQNTSTASSPLYKNSWLVLSTAFHQVHHKSTRFMLLIFVGFNFITFRFFKLFS